MTRLLAQVAMVVMSVPAMAQSPSGGAPALGAGSADWSEFGLAGGGRGAGPICASGGCGASDLRAGAFGKTSRAGLEERLNLLQDRPSGGPDIRAASPNPALEWRQHLGIRDGDEAYNCILSFGVGGELKPGGYVGSQFLGRAKTWNRPGGKDAR
jgi:hypothetical protein